MARNNTVIMLDAVAAAGVGEGRDIHGCTKTFQAWGRTTAGTGSATIDVQGSMDGENWDSLLLSPISLTLGTTNTSDSFTSDDRYALVRMVVTSISGTGASVSGAMGY